MGLNKVVRSYSSRRMTVPTCLPWHHWRVLIQCLRDVLRDNSYLDAWKEEQEEGVHRASAKGTCNPTYWMKGMTPQHSSSRSTWQSSSGSYILSSSAWGKGCPTSWQDEMSFQTSKEGLYIKIHAAHATKALSISKHRPLHMLLLRFCLRLRVNIPYLRFKAQRHCSHCWKIIAYR